MPLAAFLFALTINSVSPTVVNSSDDIVTVSASASGLQSGVTQYLQVAITKDGEATKYCGLTKNLKDEWYQYKSSPTVNDLSTYFYSFTPVSGTWSGQLAVKIDPNDDGYKGPGNYLLKLIKYISSSGSVSNNFFPIVVNIPQVASVAAVTVTEVVNPEIKTNTVNSVDLGDEFKVFVDIKNFEINKEYYLKVRAGSDIGQLTKAQTKNGDGYLSDNESWNNYPVIKTDGSGNWTGDISGLIPEEREEGIYKYRVRARKRDTETFFESGAQDIKLTRSPAPVIITPIAVIATPSISKTAISSQSAPVQEVLGTKTAEIVLTKTATPAHEVKIKTNSPYVDTFPIFVIGGGLLSSAGLMGLFMHKKTVWDIIKKFVKRQ